MSFQISLTDEAIVCLHHGVAGYLEVAGQFSG
jgi:hypothetical protein